MSKIQFQNQKEGHFFDPYEHDLDVHGGVSYDGKAYFKPSDKRHFIGFDCGHACDKVPKLSYFGENLPWRNEKYVERNCRKLINQLIKLKETFKMTTTYYFIQQPTEDLYREDYTLFTSLDKLKQVNSVEEDSKIFSVEINNKYQVIGTPIEITI